MRVQMECLVCNTAQVLKIMKIISLPKELSCQCMSEVLTLLGQVDYQKTNAEIMKYTWNCICHYTGDTDPYKEIKNFYNQQFLNIEEQCRNQIEQSENPIEVALKMAIYGNVIDFASKHQFSIEQILKDFSSIKNMPMSIDDSSTMYHQLSKAKTLLYIGDNCGEIVLDKIFIEYLKKEYVLDVYYAVRGYPIINDATIDDALMVGMDSVATIISNGDGSLGTILEKTSAEFQEIFNSADVIIAKGQGNLESLSEVTRKGIFHLCMIKCEVVARALQTEIKGIVCVQNTGGIK